VGLSILLLVLVVSVPFLQPIFNTHFPNLREWTVIISFSLVPAAAEEVSKAISRWKSR
jgi:Ca2+-transporting ATPase